MKRNKFNNNNSTNNKYLLIITNTIPPLTNLIKGLVKETTATNMLLITSENTSQI